MLATEEESIYGRLAIGPEIDTVHPISDARELMLLKRLHQAQDKPKTGFVFRNERGGAVSVNGVESQIISQVIFRFIPSE
jgi:hypothetical protein